jgi:exosortase
MERTQPSSAILAGAMLLICYALIVRGMFGQWISDEDMGHGIVVPIVIAWVVWRERDRWRAAPLRPSWWGFAFLAAGAAMHFASALGVGLFAGSVALLVSAAGVVVCLGGFALLRAWAFPFLLALFMLPKLAIVYNQVTLPLQLMASHIAAWMLSATGFGVIRDGNVLEVGGHRILVEEACSGIRYLIPLAFMGVLLGYLYDPKPWMRAVLFALAVPLAIAGNALRVAVSGAVPALAEATPHMVCGWLIFALCVGALWTMHGLIDALYTRYHHA